MTRMDSLREIFDSCQCYVRTFGVQKEPPSELKKATIRYESQALLLRILKDMTFNVSGDLSVDDFSLYRQQKLLYRKRKGEEDSRIREGSSRSGPRQ